MNRKEINEGNKLIAKFMGIETYYYSGENDMVKQNGKMQPLENWAKYHSNWNWLMPACAKFDALMMDDLKDRAKFTEYSDLLDDAVTVYAIEIAFSQLVDCIKWYNSSAEPTRTTTG